MSQTATFSNVQKGDTVKFGVYDQDYNIANGKEEIEWIVLDIEGNNALLISKYALDCQQYDSESTKKVT